MYILLEMGIEPGSVWFDQSYSSSSASVGFGPSWVRVWFGSVTLAAFAFLQISVPSVITQINTTQRRQKHRTVILSATYVLYLKYISIGVQVLCCTQCILKLTKCIHQLGSFIRLDPAIGLVLG